MVTYCFVRKTTRSHSRPRANSLTGYNVGVHYSNETTVCVTGRICPLQSLSNRGLIELEILFGERTESIKARTYLLLIYLINCPFWFVLL